MKFKKNEIINLVKNYDLKNKNEALIFISEPLFVAVGSNRKLFMYLIYLLHNLYDNSTDEIQKSIICSLDNFIREKIK